MKINKKMADKVAEFEKAQAKADELYEEIRDYFMNELEAEDFGVPFITDKPKGYCQNDQGDEFCDQYCIYEDWYGGNYYHKIEGSSKWVGYSFGV